MIVLKNYILHYNNLLLSCMRNQLIFQEKMGIVKILKRKFIIEKVLQTQIGKFET